MASKNSFEMNQLFRRFPTLPTMPFVQLLMTVQRDLALSSYPLKVSDAAAL